jgi:hypothetical protein
VIKLLRNDIDVRRRAYLALRMVVAFTLWVQYALILARVGILGSPTERSYSWQELRKWALNPSPLPEDQKLNLKYSLPIAALLFSGVVARVLTRSLLLLSLWGTVGWAVSILLTISYVRKKGDEAIMTEYGFGLRGVLLFHTLLYLASYAFTVFMTGLLIGLLSK